MQYRPLYRPSPPPLQMAVSEAWVAGQPCRLPQTLPEALNPEVLGLLHEALAQNTTGSVHQPQVRSGFRVQGAAGRG